jgi:hypothetical protein
MYPQAVSISSDLIVHLRDLYATAFNEVILRNGDSSTINGHTKLAIPAYIMAVAAIEAFINEMFLSPSGRGFLSNAPQNAAFWEALENTSLTSKLAFIPQLFFGQAFEIGKQPYQDMKKLIRLRNELVHYKMAFKQPNCVRDLQQRKIVLNEGNNTWTHNVSSLEGIRWAHDTVCVTIQKLSSFASKETHPMMFALRGLEFYNPWSDSFLKMKAEEILAKRGA